MYTLTLVYIKCKSFLAKIKKKMAILLINGFYKNHDFSKFDLNYFKQVLDSSSIASESNKKINKKKKTIIKPREFRTKIRNKLEVVFNGFFKKKI